MSYLSSLPCGQALQDSAQVRALLWTDLPRIPFSLPKQITTLSMHVARGWDRKGVGMPMATNASSYEDTTICQNWCNGIRPHSCWRGVFTVRDPLQLATDDAGRDISLIYQGHSATWHWGGAEAPSILHSLRNRDH